jgi:hypothetical protein
MSPPSYDADDAINATREAEVFADLRRAGLTEAEARGLARLGAVPGSNGQALRDAIARGEITANYAIDPYDATAMVNWFSYRRGLERRMIPPGYVEPPTTGYLSGTRPDASHDPDPLNRMATQRENEVADALTGRYGFDVEQQPTVLGNADPDYLVRGQGLYPGGEVFDAYAPQRLSWNNIWATVDGKVSRQGENIILVVDDIGVTNGQLLQQFTGNGDIPRMRSLWVMRSGQYDILIDRR